MIPTSFEELLGNEQAKNLLTKMVTKNKLAQSLLFSGPEGVGKGLFAHALSALLMDKENPHKRHAFKIAKGIHPDMRIYRPSGKLGLHSMDALKELGHDIFFPPYESQWKIFIIHEADRMLTHASNALLKIFEEPPSHALIILISHNASALLPTILSRCFTVHFRPICYSILTDFLVKQFEIEKQQAEFLAYLSQGSIGKALSLSKRQSDMRTCFLNALSQGARSPFIFDQISEVQLILEKKEHANFPHMENLNAYQRALLEKEQEGENALIHLQEGMLLLFLFFSWYRDLYTILIGCEKNKLINSDYYDAIFNAVQNGEARPLEFIQKIVEEALLDLKHANPFSLVLKNLFYKLDLLRN